MNIWLESFIQPDREDRFFKFKALNLTNSNLTVGRNVIVVGEVIADNSTLSLNGKDTKVYIDMYDDKNITDNGFNFRQDIKDCVSVAPDSSSCFGNITLNNNFSLDIGNKFTGGITATNSQITVISKNSLIDNAAVLVNSTFNI
ncbi:hypothetical protein [Providencia alcalifaciens]|uniref:hypothetical protein n=1 Tax=Providencia alcalifaciens TaxID=126385 RepID=UPI0012BCFB50|nr:hypothetical protein [Providencia alcalifaciens]